ncbi:Protein of unknown function DUF3468 [Penicillium atrosanguineum]|uniref:Uncharacterized protein n=1 Tax=Penicillium atrosanguineum TaxID=1132637 RepID=A0A9W9U2Y4_9EURO|nr:Protein of unknown function DUF3468 [Penicillium atrosanguineum]KAJ5311033.1 Protein of unknown function DUF3468 [Penicillium atrosanguineum]
MASRKKQNASRKKDGIHFVNARPASETERLKAQRLVRAHVGRWISDQTKDRSTALQATRRISHPVRDSISPLSSDQAGPSSYTLVSRSTYSPHRANGIGPGLPRFQDRRRQWQSSPFPPSHASDSSDSSDDNSSVTAHSSEPALPWENPRIESPITGVIDPFCTYPSSFSPEVVNLCEQYCLTVLWPGLVPTRANLKEAGASWFPLSLSDPALFTAFMFGSLCHQRVQWLNNWVPRDAWGPKHERILQLCEMESIKLINQAVRDPSRAVSDAVLLSVICMAHHQPEDNKRQRHRKTPFNPPFQRLQWIDVYGCLPPNLIHIGGLVQLIKLRGGLENIQFTGLPPTITFSDIFTASVFCTHPGFAFWPLDVSRNGITLQELLGFGPSDVEHGFGRLQDIGITPSMAEAFQAAFTYINIVRVSLVKGYDLPLLADQRNLTQHTLLSLLPSSDIPTSFSHPTEATTYDICRLTALIFSVGVMFPIPAQNTPLKSLAKQIQAQLSLPTASAMWSAPRNRIPLIWALTLGGIAATDTPERPFFVSALGETARRSGLTTWPQIRLTLDMMLWYDLACDEAAQILWFEAISSPTLRPIE